MLSLKTLKYSPGHTPWKQTELQTSDQWPKEEEDWREGGKK